MTDTCLKIDCVRCQHYFVTWDVNRPHGCRFFAFKSPNSPALAVFESSGKPCEAFAQKQLTQQIEQRINDNKIEGWMA